MTGIVLDTPSAARPWAAVPVDGEPVLAVRDLKKHFAVGRAWPFGRRRQLEAVDGVTRYRSGPSMRTFS